MPVINVMIYLVNFIFFMIDLLPAQNYYSFQKKYTFLPLIFSRYKNDIPIHRILLSCSNVFTFVLLNNAQIVLELV